MGKSNTFEFGGQMPPQEWFSQTADYRIQWAQSQNKKVISDILKNIKLIEKAVQKHRTEVFVYDKDLNYYKLKRRQLIQGIGSYEDTEAIRWLISGGIIINKVPDPSLLRVSKELLAKKDEALKMFKNYLDIIDGQIERLESENKRDPGYLKTLNPAIDLQQIRTLRKRLIDLGYIETIGENSFEYLFTGKPITDNMKRIKRTKKFTKQKIYYLFKSVLNYEYIPYDTVNACFSLSNAPLAKEDRTKGSGYFDLDNILK